MSRETYDINIEDIANVDIGIIKNLLSDYEYKNEVPAVLLTAIHLLFQLENYLVDLDMFIREHLGELKITIPKCEPFHFDFDSDEAKFLNVKILPKEAANVD